MNGDCFEMYLLGVRHAAESLVEFFGRTDDKAWIQEWQDKLLARLVAARLGVGKPLMILQDRKGFRWAYQTGLEHPPGQVTVLAPRDGNTVSFKAARDLGGAVLMTEGGGEVAADPYIYQEEGAAFYNINSDMRI